MFRYIQSMRRFNDVKGNKADLGIDEFDFDGLDIVVDTDAPLNIIWLLARDSWGIYETEAPHWLDEDGRVLHLDQSSGVKDAYFAELAWYSQLASDVRAANSAVLGVQES